MRKEMEVAPSLPPSLIFGLYSPTDIVVDRRIEATLFLVVRTTMTTKWSPFFPSRIDNKLSS